MKSVSKAQFGQLNGKRFYFSNGIMSLPFGHPCLEDLRKGKHRYRHINKIIQQKKIRFSKRGKQGSRKYCKIKYSSTNFWTNTDVI